MFRWCKKTIEIITFRILIKNKSTITCSDIKKKTREPSLRVIVTLMRAWSRSSEKHIFLGVEWFVAAKIGGQRKKQRRRTHTLLPSRSRPDSFASHITDDLSGYRDLRNLKSKRCARASKVIQIPSADINPAIHRPSRSADVCFTDCESVFAEQSKPYG